MLNVESENDKIIFTTPSSLQNTTNDVTVAVSAYLTSKGVGSLINIGENFEITSLDLPGYPIGVKIKDELLSTFQKEPDKVLTPYASIDTPSSINANIQWNQAPIPLTTSTMLGWYGCKPDKDWSIVLKTDARCKFIARWGNAWGENILNIYDNYGWNADAPGHFNVYWTNVISLSVMGIPGDESARAHINSMSFAVSYDNSLYQSDPANFTSITTGPQTENAAIKLYLKIGDGEWTLPELSQATHYGIPVDNSPPSPSTFKAPYYSGSSYGHAYGGASQIEELELYNDVWAPPAFISVSKPDPILYYPIKNKWQFYVASKKGDLIKFYVDGNLIGSLEYKNTNSLKANQYFTSATTITTNSDWPDGAGFEIAHSSHHNGEGWNAFRDPIAGANNWGWTSGASGAQFEWVSITYPSPVILRKYVFTARNNDQHYPKKWLIEGSNDSGTPNSRTWTAIGTEQEVNSWVARQVTEVNVDFNTIAYSSYRVKCEYVDNPLRSIGYIQLYTTESLSELYFTDSFNAISSIATVSYTHLTLPTKA